MCCLRWHNFGVKPSSRLEEIGTSFFFTQTLHMDMSGLIHWIMKISIVEP
jgi:hypothetical protein